MSKIVFPFDIKWPFDNAPFWGGNYVPPTPGGDTMEIGDIVYNKIHGAGSFSGTITSDKLNLDMEVPVPYITHTFLPYDYNSDAFSFAAAEPSYNIGAAFYGAGEIFPVTAQQIKDALTTAGMTNVTVTPGLAEGDWYPFSLHFSDGTLEVDRTLKFKRIKIDKSFEMSPLSFAFPTIKAEGSYSGSYDTGVTEIEIVPSYTSEAVSYSAGDSIVNVGEFSGFSSVTFNATHKTVDIQFQKRIGPGEVSFLQLPSPTA